MEALVEVLGVIIRLFWKILELWSCEFCDTTTKKLSCHLPPLFPPRHSPYSVPGFASRFPAPPDAVPSSTAHLRSFQAILGVVVGAVTGWPGCSPPSATAAYY